MDADMDMTNFQIADKDADMIFFLSLAMMIAKLKKQKKTYVCEMLILDFLVMDKLL